MRIGTWTSGLGVFSPLGMSNGRLCVYKAGYRPLPPSSVFDTTQLYILTHIQRHVCKYPQRSS